jgi:chromosome segregation ATPase
VHADETKSLQVEASLLRLALDHERTVSQGWQAACAAKVTELATALRERGEALAREAGLASANAALADSVTRCAGIESELDALRAEVTRLRAKMTEMAEALASAADDIDSGDVEGFREALREGALAASGQEEG